MSRIAVFDLDDTLLIETCDNQIIPADDSKSILEYLYSQNIPIALASHNANAEKIIEKLGWSRYFSLILNYFDWTNKADHLHKISKYFDVPFSSLVFWDDLSENIASARKLGVDATRVDWKVGVTLEQVKNKFPLH